MSDNNWSQEPARAPFKMRVDPEGDLALGRSYVVARLTGLAAPICFFGVEEGALTLYPTPEAAQQGVERAEQLRGHVGEWHVQPVVWGMAVRLVEVDEITAPDGAPEGG